MSVYVKTSSSVDTIISQLDPTNCFEITFTDLNPYTCYSGVYNTSIATSPAMPTLPAGTYLVVGLVTCYGWSQNTAAIARIANLDNQSVALNSTARSSFAGIAGLYTSAQVVTTSTLTETTEFRYFMQVSCARGTFKFAGAHMYVYQLLVS